MGFATVLSAKTESSAAPIATIQSEPHTDFVCSIPCYLLSFFHIDNTSFIMIRAHLK